MLFYIIAAIGIPVGFLLGYGKKYVSTGYYADERRKASKNERIFFGVGGAIGMACMFTAVSIVVCMLVAAIDRGDPSSFAPPERTARILSLDDKSTSETNSSGFFVIAFGGYSSHEDETFSYGFYQEAADGTYFFHKISTDFDTSIRIKLTGPDVPPTVKRYQPDKRYETPGWIAPFDLSPDSIADEKWVISVPEGTIVTRYKLDGK